MTRPRTLTAGALAALVTLAASPLHAQDWAYSASLYGWLPGFDIKIDTPDGTVESDPSGGDIFDALEGVFMGDFEARSGPWTLLLDLVYVDLENEANTPSGFTTGAVKTRATALTAYALYRTVDNPGVTLDLGAGFRFFSVEVDTLLEAGGGALSRRSNAADDWVVPVIAARVEVPFNETWFVEGSADWGATDADTQTWQAYAGVGYRFNESWSTELGYRYMEVEKDIDGLNTELGLGGPQIGFTYRF